VAANRGETARRRIGDVRADIMAGATRLFAERGFDGVTTRDICAAARVPMSGVYRHFQDKRALYRDCALAAYETASVAIWTNLAPDLPPARAVYRYALGLSDLYFAHGDVPKLILRTMIEQDTDLVRTLSDQLVLFRARLIVARLGELGLATRAQAIVHGIHAMTFGYANMAPMIANLAFDLPQLETARGLAVAILALLAPEIDWATQDAP
jgi:AcrR family transcriptional regulator